eukprot:scaffold14246_cov105-Isochrysis_galbana.AAC.12
MSRWTTRAACRASSPAATWISTRHIKGSSNESPAEAPPPEPPPATRLCSSCAMSPPSASSMMMCSTSYWTNESTNATTAGCRTRRMHCTSMSMSARSASADRRSAGALCARCRSCPCRAAPGRRTPPSAHPRPGLERRRRPIAHLRWPPAGAKLSAGNLPPPPRTTKPHASPVPSLHPSPLPLLVPLFPPPPFFLNKIVKRKAPRKLTRHAPMRHDMQHRGSGCERGCDGREELGRDCEER